MSQLNERLDKKDEYTAALQARVSSVEADQLEQYSRRTNLRFSGNPRVTQVGRHHRLVAVHCQRNSGNDTSHCERRRSDK